MANSFGSEAILRVGDREYTIHRLDAVTKKHPNAARLPFSLKILLENLLRTEDGLSVRPDDISALANWDPKAQPNKEIAAGDSLYGLFVPMPLRQPDSGDFLDNPHRILIFKRPLEDDFPDPGQLRIEIRKTVIHELAHHFGWTDKDLERFDDKPDPFGEMGGN